jgi:site-specific DNA-cytosine methylase
VRDAFLARGHDAWSCDLLPCEADPARHVQGDLFKVFHERGPWDLVIAHPPCTALAVSGNRWHAGTQGRLDAAALVKAIWALPVERLCIENPVGVLNRLLPELPRPHYVQPWQFGHGETKRTGLWLRGLPPLVPTCIVDGREQRVWKMGPSPDRWKERSRTYEGIARAMAAQWG